jgi:hypothetical protein
MVWTSCGRDQGQQRHRPLPGSGSSYIGVLTPPLRPTEPLVEPILTPVVAASPLTTSHHPINPTPLHPSIRQRRVLNKHVPTHQVDWIDYWVTIPQPDRGSTIVVPDGKEWYQEIE